MNGWRDSEAGRLKVVPTNCTVPLMTKQIVQPFFATFRGTHVGDGGPVEPTQQQTNSEYVYVVGMNEEGKVANMCKIWNAPWALAELGWA